MLCLAMADSMDGLLITGAGGFLGGHIASERAMAEPQRRLVLIDSAPLEDWNTATQNLRTKSNAHVIRADVRDGHSLAQIMRDYRISQVIHAASSAHLGDDPSELLDANVASTLILLEVCRVAWLQSDMVNTHKFHFISCADILQANATGTVFDAAPVAPETLYCASMAAAEAFVSGYAHRHRINATISYPTHIYGPGQKDQCLIPGIIHALLDGKRIPLYGECGVVVDLLHVNDAARAISAVADRGTSGNRYGINGARASTAEIIATLCRAVDAIATRTPDFALRFPKSAPAMNKLSASLITKVQDRRTLQRPRAYMFNALATVLANPDRKSIVDGLQETLAACIAPLHKSAAENSQPQRRIA
jgi:dTDP-glucose 4,6-dehydratase